MNSMRIMAAATAAALLAISGPARQASGLEVLSGENTMNIGGRLQLMGALEVIDDEWNDSERLFLFLKQARMNVSGTYKDADYMIGLMFGGEEVPKNNSVMSLLDAYVNIPVYGDLLEIRLGQFKVPYGRERLLDSGAMFNTERSINNRFFNIGRDVGMAVHGRAGLFTAAAGVFTGGGINIPERYIPEDLGFPMVVARAGVNSGLDRDVLNPFQNASGRGDGARFAAYLNGAYTKDSRVGHSTPLLVKYHDKSLFLNPNWNPYISARDQKAEFSQVGADVAAELPLSEQIALLLSAEVNYGHFKNDAGSIETTGGVVGAFLLSKNWEFGVRYAVVDPGSKYGYALTDPDTGERTVYSITDRIIHELTPGLVYYLHQYNLKLIADFSVQFDVPVSKEPGNGVYNLMLQPDQVTYVSRGGVELQDAYIGKLVVQYEF